MTSPKYWLHVGNDIIQKSKFKPVRNGHLFSKAYGGIWASPFRLQDQYYSHWHYFLANELNVKEKLQAVVFTIKNSARMCIIDSQEDLIRFVDKVGTYPTPFPCMFTKPINFENASNYYDVIYLTERGQWKTRMPFENKEYNLYGWDVECCFIMNPDVIERQQAVEIKGEREREELELFE